MKNWNSEYLHKPFREKATFNNIYLTMRVFRPKYETCVKMSNYMKNICLGFSKIFALAQVVFELSSKPDIYLIG